MIRVLSGKRMCVCDLLITSLSFHSLLPSGSMHGLVHTVGREVVSPRSCIHTSCISDMPRLAVASRSAVGEIVVL